MARRLGLPWVASPRPTKPIRIGAAVRNGYCRSMASRMRYLTVALVLSMGACSSQAVSPSMRAAPARVESSPSARVTVMPTSPTASREAEATDLLPASIVEVTVDGLAVRRGPGTAYEQLGAARFTANGVEPLGTPYRLMEGEELYIQEGPLRVDGTAWYSVRYLGDVMWVTPGGTDSTVEGWVAAGEGGIAYLQVSRVPDELCCFYASGVGSGVTPPLPRVPSCPEGYPCVIPWVAGQGDPAGTCELRMTVETTHALIVEESITGVTHGVVMWTEEGAAVVVDSECSWSLAVTYFALP